MHKMARTAAHEAEKNADKMRKKALSAAAKRKEEFLGARVPKELKERVMARAEELGIPVSLLIRKVLEEVFLEATQASLTDISGQLKSPLGSTQESRLSAVLGWKSLELNRSHACDRCGQELLAGTEVVMGVTPDNGMMIICSTCKEQLKA